MVPSGRTYVTDFENLYFLIGPLLSVKVMLVPGINSPIVPEASVIVVVDNSLFLCLFPLVVVVVVFSSLTATGASLVSVVLVVELSWHLPELARARYPKVAMLSILIIDFIVLCFFLHTHHRLEEHTS